MIIFFTFLGLCLAQTAYSYLPVTTNYLLVRHQTATGTSLWGERTVWDYVSSIDAVSGISGNFYCRASRDSLYYSHQVDTIQAMWIRPDASGNMVVGAWGKSFNLKSATIINPPMIFLSNAMCLPGSTNTVTIPTGNNHVEIDTTISNSETVSVPGGTFTKCLETHRTIDSAGVKTHEYIDYYAPNIGLILEIQLYPLKDTNRSELISYKITSINEREMQLPSAFHLDQNYPNPFNPSTTINYSVPKPSSVTITVYDVLGREVKTLVNENKPAGNFSVQFDGIKLTSGIYIYRLQAGSFSQTKKLILLK